MIESRDCPICHKTMRVDEVTRHIRIEHENYVKALTMKPIHKSIKEAVGSDPKMPDIDFYIYWTERIKKRRKPCEMRASNYHCPTVPGARHDFYRFPNTKAHEQKLYQGYLENGLTFMTYNPENYPEEIPKDLLEMVCSDDGHICPIYLGKIGLSKVQYYNEII